MEAPPPNDDGSPSVVVSRRGARRWRAGHPWIYRSDVADETGAPGPGIVAAVDPRGRPLGQALYSPASEIRLRFLTGGSEPIDGEWWRRRIVEAVARRAFRPTGRQPPGPPEPFEAAAETEAPRDAASLEASAYRLVHAEADGLPSLIVDRYGPYVVAQLLSAGLETVRADVLGALVSAVEPDGVLLRNDPPVRRHEGLPREVEVAHGHVPDRVDVVEHGVRYRVDLHRGQKTGAFLDQRENRRLAGVLARGRALDAFCGEGGFALHLARGAEHVLAIDSSAGAIGGARDNAELNGLDNVEWREDNVFDALRELERARETFDVIVLDPPAFAKRRRGLDAALRGYKEINLRAMRLLEPGGRLLTFSCSYHVSPARFKEMLRAAAGDAGRRLFVERTLRQASDHPELLTVPETSYLKGALLMAE